MSTELGHPLDLTGKVALVTGGNSGIGRAAATALARAGASVAIWGRRKERNEAVAEELRAIGATVYAASVDISDPEAVRAGAEAVIETLGRLDIAFANAGDLVPSAGFLDTGDEARGQQFGTVLDGTWNTVAAAARHMVARAEAGDPGGSIILTGSLAAKHGAPGLAHYGAAKAALVGLAKSTAVEFGRHGVRVNVINPGFIATETGGAPFAELLAQRAPVPRYGQPGEIAGAVVYLASDAAAYHTGDVLTIDGGWTSAVM
ncbi:SDR family NAD(P)-dependent oxidoreductase [Streptomyces sp. NPDC090075]|uniref:SDR family NAD(P)-dependent oxidoreductase n=1 Tax=Streptomyces sp. NPDC090075 TaxID=3365937 RepID=UPI00381DFE7F